MPELIVYRYPCRYVAGTSSNICRHIPEKILTKGFHLQHKMRFASLIKKNKYKSDARILQNVC